MRNLKNASSNFNELLFENRNKNYGAYVIRKEYNENLIKSFFAAMLLLLNNLLARLRVRWPKLRHLVEGSPTLLVLHGKPIQDHLRQEGLDEEILETALREHGVASLEDVEMAVLEIDGSISIVPKQATTHRVKHPLKYLRH